MVLLGLLGSHKEKVYLCTQTTTVTSKNRKKRVYYPRSFTNPISLSCLHFHPCPHGEREGFLSQLCWLIHVFGMDWKKRRFKWWPSFILLDRECLTPSILLLQLRFLYADLLLWRKWRLPEPLRLEYDFTLPLLFSFSGETIKKSALLFKKVGTAALHKICPIKWFPVGAING